MPEHPPAFQPGHPWPLGLSFTGDGANLAVFSEHALAIELCLFDAAGAVETARLRLPERTDGVFHGHLPGLAPGRVYGLRAHGPWDPVLGHRFNPAKLLLDPYARALVGDFRWAGPNLVDEADPFALDPRDSAPFVPKAAAVPAPAPAADEGRPRVPWERTLLYEAHVRGLTKLHPAVPAAERGTYRALGHPALVEHLARLGITAIELLPVAAFLDERRLVRQGLANYWGYNPHAFMVPEGRYAVADPLAELRDAIRALHGAGIEVILDVVFNHTAETDEFGPTLSFRGLDNAAYYRLRPDDRRLYVNHTGTGNTLNLAHPRVLQLVLDSLRHWAAQGVDGFRFDLGLTLGRGADDRFDADAAFFQALRQDPLLGRLKLVAEPWDIGPGGYRLGGFPPPFAEWNDRFRDTVRRFWRGDEAVAPDLAARLLGSADLFEGSGRRAWASLNLVTAHDGFTLRDLVSYERRHNEANGEANRDGHGENWSANHGVEGPCAEPAIQAARALHARNLLATLLLAQGTPMLQMGDELGRTQRGNNNAYCQDNAISWQDWTAAGGEGRALTRFVQRLARLRAAHPVLRRRRFLHGRERSAEGLPDVAWLAAHGGAVSIEEWHDPHLRCLGLVLAGDAGPEPTPEGGPGGDDTLLLLLNADTAPAGFRLPCPAGLTGWRLLLDTAEPERADEPLHAAGLRIELAPSSLRLLAGIAAPVGGG
jgi:glycogen operon protein